MSHWISLTDTTASGVGVEMYDANWTYNFSPALHEAGLVWANCVGKLGEEIAPVAEDAYEKILADPEHYRPLIRGGGASLDTGTLETLISQLREFAEACRTHHKATFDRV